MDTLNTHIGQQNVKDKSDARQSRAGVFSVSFQVWFCIQYFRLGGWNQDDTKTLSYDLQPIKMGWMFWKRPIAWWGKERESEKAAHCEIRWPQWSACQQSRTHRWRLSLPRPAASFIPFRPFFLYFIAEVEKTRCSFKVNYMSFGKMLGQGQGFS